MNSDGTSNWMLSQKIQESFCYAAYITLFGLFLVFVTTILSMTVLNDFETVHLPASPGTLSLFVILFVLVAILLAAGFYLCLGMVFFLFKLDERPMIAKIALLPLFVIGSTLTATVYYFLVYRGISRQGRVAQGFPPRG